MKILFRIFSFLLVVVLCFVTARYLWAKYIQGKQSEVGDILIQTKDELLSQNGLLGQVLGESAPKEDLGQYLRQQLPADIQSQVEQSEVVKQLQTEITNIVDKTSQEIKELPVQEVKKIKKGVAEEICRQLLEENE